MLLSSLKGSWRLGFLWLGRRWRLGWRGWWRGRRLGWRG